MEPLISATTLHSHRYGSRFSRADTFLAKASRLPAQAAQARSQERLADAVEFAYQAGLRAAGARLAEAGSPRSRSRRAGQGAFDRLRKLSVADAAWAERMSRFSRVRSRLAIGLDSEVETKVVDRLISEVSAFLASIEAADELSAA